MNDKKQTPLPHQEGNVQEELLNVMNKALEDEFMAIRQYTTYAAQVTGVHRIELKDFFQEEIPDEQGHAQFLADKIVALGGTPTHTSSPLPQVSTNKDMLTSVLEAEQQAITTHNQLATLAEDIGDKGLVVKIEDIITDETRHKEEVEKILQGFSE